MDPHAPPEAVPSTRLEIRAASLLNVFRGSRHPSPAYATGEFVQHTAGTPPNALQVFTHQEHSHLFIIHWEYETEGGFFVFVSLFFCILFLFFGVAILSLFAPFVLLIFSYSKFSNYSFLFFELAERVQAAHATAQTLWVCVCGSCFHTAA